MSRSAFNSDLIRVQNPRRVNPLYYRPLDIAPSPIAIPKTLLIDGDQNFVQTFSGIARRLRVPFESMTQIPDVEAMEDQKTWNYNLILLDEKTIGRKNVLETAQRLNKMGDVSIILVGTNTPTPEELSEWHSVIKRFLCKNDDVDALFRDVMRILATEARDYLEDFSGL